MSVRSAAPLAALPQPPATPLLGHMWHWTFAPVPLLLAGARAGEVFRLRLWRQAVVGYRPDWNRGVLGDLDTFRSQGSLSGLTPYLSAGVVHTDPPAHLPHRQALNPHFHSRAVQRLTEAMRAAVAAVPPPAEFDALAWSATVVRRMLAAALFGDRIPDPLLARFLAPLHLRQPAPLLPRPRLFRRMNAAIAAVLADPAPDTIAAALAPQATAASAAQTTAASAAQTTAAPAAAQRLDPVTELRVALAAGYDTTAHTLAWTLWWLAGSPGWREVASLPWVLDEIQRLYPAGWLGSRVTHRDTVLCGVDLPAGTLVLYSPYLTHRDPTLWPQPEKFRPDRFADGRPAWGFIPFAAGRRTCLGAHLARAMLTCAVEPFLGGTPLRQLGGDPRPQAGITLRPAGPLWLQHGAGAGGRPRTG